MKLFIEDFTAEYSNSRYLTSSLPLFPLKDEEFDLSLCSHFLFLFSFKHDREFHVKSIKEMCRVSKQARIFPMLELAVKESRHLSAFRAELESESYDAGLNLVPFELQKGGNQTPRVQRA